MSNFGAILTTAGAAKLANAIALGVPLKLTQMVVGDGNGQPVAPDPAMTAIPGEKRRAAINTLFADPLAASQLVAEQIIPEDVGGWWITSAVELKIDPSVVLATRKYVDDVMKAHKESRDHPDASETAKGFTRYATQVEVNDSAAASATAVVTVKTLWGWVKQATETVLGMMKVASQDQVIAGTADDVAVTPKKLRMGFAMKIGTTGYFSCPVWLGSFILQWGNLTVPAGTVGGIKADIIFPISYPNGAFGIATASGVDIGSLDTNSEYRLCRQDFSVGIPTQTGVSAQAFVENYALHSRRFYWISLGR